MAVKRLRIIPCVIDSKNETKPCYPIRPQRGKLNMSPIIEKHGHQGRNFDFDIGGNTKVLQDKDSRSFFALSIIGSCHADVGHGL